MAKKGGKQPGAGRPRKIISEEDKIKAGEYALKGLTNNTICTLMDWNHGFIEKKKDIKRHIDKKRAERRELKRAELDEHAKKNPVMAIFQAKNELGMADRQDHKLNVKFSEIRINI
jgi:hypothetical protein